MGLDMYLQKAPRWGSLTQMTALREALYENEYSFSECSRKTGHDGDKATLMVIDQKKSILIASGIPSECFPLVTSANSLFTEVAYWRKFNALHAWFVNQCQGGIDECQYAEVTEEKFKTILDILHYVYQSRDHTALKPESGFFFGSTDIDDWYWENVKNGIDQLEKIKSEIDFSKEILVYHSSW